MMPDHAYRPHARMPPCFSELLTSICPDVSGVAAERNPAQM